MNSLFVLGPNGYQRVDCLTPTPVLILPPNCGVNPQRACGDVLPIAKVKDNRTGALRGPEMNSLYVLGPNGYQKIELLSAAPVLILPRDSSCVNPQGPCGDILPITKALDDDQTGAYVLKLKLKTYRTDKQRRKAIALWLENDVPDCVYNRVEKDHLLAATPYIFAECGSRDLEIHIPETEGFFVRYR